MEQAKRDLEAEVAAQEVLQRTDPKRAYAEMGRIKRLAAECEALGRRARDLVRA